ncbi:MAG: 2-C-methyl-D-erythritol 2,4-cyclodiphosphate synthase [Clostridia bacterium]|nr:2-C-methyl-D-erythritol 2,4-cyclodiphosphate synthase [Clostridia bacterium]
MRIGFGYDVHRLTEQHRLILGGVEIPHSRGLLGHSDADVLVHSIMDAMLGALSLGDIGKHFPDTDGQYKDINSMLLLSRVKEIIEAEGYEMGNLDCTVCAQKPKLLPYIETMRQNLAEVLGTDVKNISVKATTTEKLGFCGREEGISSYAVCLLKQK